MPGSDIYIRELRKHIDGIVSLTSEARIEQESIVHISEIGVDIKIGVVAYDAETSWDPRQTANPSA